MTPILNHNFVSLFKILKTTLMVALLGITCMSCKVLFYHDVLICIKLALHYTDESLFSEEKQESFALTVLQEYCLGD